jgi:hypothetical protein
VCSFFGYFVAKERINLWLAAPKKKKKEEIPIVCWKMAIISLLFFLGGAVYVMIP